MTTVLAIACLLLAVLVIGEGLVIIEAVRQIAQIRVRLGLDDEPQLVTLGDKVGMEFPRQDLLGHSAAAVVTFLTVDCGTCRTIARSVAKAHAEDETVALLAVVEGGDDVEVDMFLRETGIARRRAYVDSDHEIARQVGVTVRPATVTVREGLVVEAAAVGTPYQFERVLERLSATVAENGRAPDGSRGRPTVVSTGPKGV